jgi:pantoate--beta-alanine ligase
MAHDLNLEAEVVACPIVREQDGLALSSRNSYLKPGERQAATALSRALISVRREIEAAEYDAVRLLTTAQNVIGAEKLVTLDYAELVDAETFEPVTRLRKSCLLLLAALVGSTRLIDNALIEGDGERFRVDV